MAKDIAYIAAGYVALIATVMLSPRSQALFPASHSLCHELLHPIALLFGDVVDAFVRIAALWNGMLAAAGVVTSRPLDAHDAANFMEALKIARRYSGPNVDDYIDAAGYAAVAGEIRFRSAKERS